MASLLHKFRIEFASVEIVVGLDGDPSPERYILGTLDTVINVYFSFMYSMFNVLQIQFIKTISTVECTIVTYTNTEQKKFHALRKFILTPESEHRLELPV